MVCAPSEVRVPDPENVIPLLVAVVREYVPAVVTFTLIVTVFAGVIAVLTAYVPATT
jgi:hypothetical protein